MTDIYRKSSSPSGNENESNFFYVRMKLDSGQFINVLHIIMCMFPARHLKLSALIVTNRVQGSEQMLTRAVALPTTWRMNLSQQ
jgi:hypothetical protein